VGRRTAERLSVELRGRLKERFTELLEGPLPDEEAALPDGASLPLAAGVEEVQLTLEALGYEALEIHRALRAVAAAGSPGADDTDAWIRDCLRWLSSPAA
jgi:Holliday junction DNA helicase RuvA